MLLLVELELKIILTLITTIGQAVVVVEQHAGAPGQEMVPQLGGGGGGGASK